MARRFITREDVTREARDGVLEVGPDDIITAAAEEIATRRKISIRRSDAPRAPGAPPSDAPVFAPPRSTAADGGQVIVAAVGRNRPYVLAEITTRLAELGGNIRDISQSIVQDYFQTLLIVDISEIAGDFKTFKERLEELSREGDYRLSVQHEDVFRAMHRI